MKKPFTSSFLARAAMTLLLALFVTASAWAGNALIFGDDGTFVQIDVDYDVVANLNSYENGSLFTAANAGQTVYFGFTLKEGYELASLTFRNISPDDVTPLSNGIYSFIMPEGEDTWVYVYINSKKIPVVVEGVDINEENFPDTNFRNFLLAQSFGTDAVITEQEMANIVKISARDQGIEDLTGIEYFTELIQLDLSNSLNATEASWNRISAINLSSNTKLQKLYLSNNKLESIDLSNLGALEILDVYNNLLTELDLSNCKFLTMVTCSGNQLTSLDFQSNPKLSLVSCSDNKLTSLDFTQNELLNQLYCDNNQLAAIDVTNHPELIIVNCYNNQLTALDVTGCPELYQLYCYNNKIKGDAMGALVNSLPEFQYAYCVLLDLESEIEENEITDEQIAVGKAKGWSIEAISGEDFVRLPIGSGDEHEYVDLGLPSGTLWATCNVGASSPQDAGLYFAWGDTEGHGADVSDGYLFSWENYKWAEVLGNDSYFTKYCVDNSSGLDGFSDNKYVLDPEDDAAYVNWGDQWRTPSKAQFDELKSECTWTPATVQGVNGYVVEGPSGNSIFLPVTGWRIEDLLLDGGAYWARNAQPDNDGGAYQFAWEGESWYEYAGRCNGQCVRPVVNVEPEVPVYYLIGEFCGWDDSRMLPFTDNEGTSLTTTFSGPFKIKDKYGNWLGGDESHNTLTRSQPSVTLGSGGQDLHLEMPNEYLFVIENGETTKLTVYDFLTGYFIAGDFNDWQPEQLTDNGDGTYTIQETISVNQEFKFRDPDGRWYGGDTHSQSDKYGVDSERCTNIPLTEGDAGSNFIINADGLFTFVLTDAGGSLTFDVVGFNGLIALTDNDDNTEAIEYGSTGTHDAELLGRTLYRDGNWNTLCLPFDVTLSGSPLDGAEARTLEGASIEGSTLTLGFSDPVDVLSAGVPYIIKWENNDPDITQENIFEPVFSGVTFSTQLNPVEIEGVLTFTGTYSPVSIPSAGDNTKLYLGSGNQLYYPNGAMTIGSQRAFFQFADGITAGDPDDEASPIKAFVLNFGEENGISVVKATSSEGAGWYDLSGRRHDAMPSAPGIYLHNGKKLIVK